MKVPPGETHGKDQAEQIVTAFKSICGKLKRAMVGLPVYKGHPDVAGMEAKYPDKTEYGQVAEMEVRDEMRPRHQACVLFPLGAGLRAGRATIHFALTRTRSFHGHSEGGHDRLVAVFDLFNRATENPLPNIPKQARSRNLLTRSREQIAS